MRYPESHKLEVRGKIVRAAAAALRRHGLSGVSIPALMKEAGLTHGGFYAHFSDRDELVAEAVRAAAGETGEGVFGADLPLEESLRRYLSAAHLAHPEEGCVVAALGSDGARQGRKVRGAFAWATLGLLRLVDRKLRPAAHARAPSDEALRATATMVGAVMLGRLVDDPALAARILKAARAAVPPRSQVL